MAKKSGFVERQNAVRAAFFDAGLQMGRQQIIDMMCLVLNNPKIMGKNTFGRLRLNGIVTAIGKCIDEYYLAFVRHDETDYWRKKLDDALAAAFDDENFKDSFMKRYEFLPDFDYKKGKWER